MQQISVWHITTRGPRKLNSSHIALEKELEEWIEKDPNLLEAGLVIIGRQIPVDSGRLDLLGLDVQGNLVIVEIKKGVVSRDTITQAIDYASSVKKMPEDKLFEKAAEYLGRHTAKSNIDVLFGERRGKRESSKISRGVKIYVVGTGKQPDLERIVGFLSEYKIPITVVAYDVLEIDKGQRILIRELTETERTPIQAGPKTSVNEIIDQAQQNGIGETFRILYDAATRHGLYARPWTTCIMYAPPTKRKRCLFTVWSKPRADGKIVVWGGSTVFADFYPVTEKFATEMLGKQGWRNMTMDDVKAYVDGLDKLFGRIDHSK